MSEFREMNFKKENFRRVIDGFPRVISLENILIIFLGNFQKAHFEVIALRFSLSVMPRELREISGFSKGIFPLNHPFQKLLEPMTQKKITT